MSFSMLDHRGLCTNDFCKNPQIVLSLCSAQFVTYYSAANTAWQARLHIVCRAFKEHPGINKDKQTASVQLVYQRQNSTQKAQKEKTTVAIAQTTSCTAFILQQVINCKGQSKLESDLIRNVFLLFLLKRRQKQSRRQTKMVTMLLCDSTRLI